MFTQSFTIPVPVALLCSAILIGIFLMGDIVAVQHLMRRWKCSMHAQDLRDMQRVYANEERSREALRVGLLALLDQLANMQLTCDEKHPLHAEKAALMIAIELVMDKDSHKLDGFTKWYKELEVADSNERSNQWWRERGVLLGCSVALGHVLVFQDQAVEQWVDFIGYSLSSKKQFLLQTLQQCLIEEGVYTAIAKRKLAHNSGADVTNEFRKVLILWSTSAAIRLILKMRKEGVNRRLSFLEEMQVFDSISGQYMYPFIGSLHARTSQLCALLRDACVQTYAS
jgi:hypothetical protein